MALRPTCDVFGTAKRVVRYEIAISEVDEKDVHMGNSDLHITVVDLCPRALDRLKAKIVAGTTPPAERKKKDVPGQAALEK